MTEDTKYRMGIQNIGRVVSIETRRKQSENGAKGEKNINWKGGVTPINETIRKSIDYKICHKKTDTYLVKARSKHMSA